MKKLIVMSLVIILSSVCYAKKTPIIIYDPNTVTESLVDPNNVTITVQVEISKEQYEAMQYLNVTLIDAVDQSGLSRILDGWIDSVKFLLTKDKKISEIKVKLE